MIHQHLTVQRMNSPRLDGRRLRLPDLQLSLTDLESEIEVVQYEYQVFQDLDGDGVAEGAEILRAHRLRSPSLPLVLTGVQVELLDETCDLRFLSAAEFADGSRVETRGSLSGDLVVR